jgi:hypothetical protein
MPTFRQAFKDKTASDNVVIIKTTAKRWIKEVEFTFSGFLFVIQLTGTHCA